MELDWCKAGDTAYVYIGEKEEFFDNHAAIRNSFNPDQISTFSFLSAKSYDCGPIKTFGDIADFFNVNIEDYMGNETFKTSNNVTLEFANNDRETEAYPCGFRALAIRSGNPPKSKLNSSFPNSRQLRPSSLPRHKRSHLELQHQNLQRRQQSQLDQSSSQ